MKDISAKQYLIVEDDPDNRAWLIQILESAFPGSVVHNAPTLAQAYDYLRQQEYYLLLIDIHLPDGNGIDLVRHINKASNTTLCIMATAFDDDDNLFSALQAGADGYLLKSDTPERITEQLQGILHHSPPLTASIARRIMLHFHRSPNQKENLSPRETEVLRLLTLGKSNKAISETLNLSVHTVGDYIKSIYRKLKVSNRAAAASKAVRDGLVDAQ